MSINRHLARLSSKIGCVQKTLYAGTGDGPKSKVDPKATNDASISTPNDMNHSTVFSKCLPGSDCTKRKLWRSKQKAFKELLGSMRKKFERSEFKCVAKIYVYAVI